MPETGGSGAGDASPGHLPGFCIEDFLFTLFWFQLARSTFMASFEEGAELKLKRPKRDPLFAYIKAEASSQLEDLGLGKARALVRWGT